MELSLCHKLRFSNPYIFTTQCRRPYIFQTMSSVRSNNTSLKYQSFTLSDCKDIGIIKFEFVAKTIPCNKILLRTPGAGPLNVIKNTGATL